MADLIRREDVIDAIRGERKYLIARKQYGAENALAHHFDAIMDNIPAVDAVEVVRCQECLFWNRGRISCEGLARCLTGETGIRYRNENDYCSRGKRREDGDT